MRSALPSVLKNFSKSCLSIRTVPVFCRLTKTSATFFIQVPSCHRSHPFQQSQNFPARTSAPPAHPSLFTIFCSNLVTLSAFSRFNFFRHTYNLSAKIALLPPCHRFGDSLQRSAQPSYPHTLPSLSTSPSSFQPKFSLCSSSRCYTPTPANFNSILTF